MSQKQILERLVGKPLAIPTRREHEPRRRVKQGGLDIGHEAHAAIIRGIPLRKAPVLQRLKSIVSQWVMVVFRVKRNVDVVKWTKVFEEKEVGE